MENVAMIINLFSLKVFHDSDNGTQHSCFFVAWREKKVVSRNLI